MKSFKFQSTVAALAVFVSLAGCAATQTTRTAGETVDDATIGARVKAALIENDTTKARQINVETFRGVVQLNGFVDSAAEKSAASRVAKSVNGVTRVDNNLAVKGKVGDGDRSAGTTVDDAALTGKVKTALIGNPNTKARQINVTTYEGVVQLSGFVDSNEQKRAAEETAHSIEGVKSVRNNLEIKSNP